MTNRNDLEEQLRQSLSTFDVAFHVAAIGMALADVSGHLIEVNSAFSSMLGYEPTDLAGVDFRDITHPDDIDTDNALFDQLLDGSSDSYHMEKRYFRQDGSIAHAMLSVAVVRDLDSKPIHFVAQIVDIGDRKAAEQALIEANTRLSLAMGMIDGGFWHYDIATGIFEPSEQFARLVGGPAASAKNFLEFSSLVSKTDRQAASLKALIAGELERAVAEYRVRTYEGHIRWFRCRRQLIRNGDGVPVQIIGIVIDISEERARHAQLEASASTDMLTGLLNRRGLAEHTKDFASHRTEQGVVGVIVLDLDHFKRVNDRLGHVAGDAILVEAAQRLKTLVRPTDAAVRLGGDEFAILLRNTSETAARRAVQRVLKVMHERYGYKGELLTVGASAGVAVKNDSDRSFPDLLARADAALYSAKQAGRGTWRLAA
jgi:diguanylate cyclase (GGDEF)-like protein/PAS domain S-box-containing protein